MSIFRYDGMDISVRFVKNGRGPPLGAELTTDGFNQRLKY